MDFFIMGIIFKHTFPTLLLNKEQHFLDLYYKYYSYI